MAGLPTIMLSPSCEWHLEAPDTGGPEETPDGGHCLRAWLAHPFAVIAIVAVVSFVLGAGAEAFAFPAPHGQVMADLAQQVAATVVAVSSCPWAVSERSVDGIPRRNVARQGSGVIVDHSGYVATSDRLIDGAGAVDVSLSTGSTYAAKMIGRDPQAGLALLKIAAARPLPAATFGNSDVVRVGDWVMSAGEPYGWGIAVTQGIVSAHVRGKAAGRDGELLEINAGIVRGDLGGPTLNLAGQVIGINTMIASPRDGGMGFAVPAALAESILGRLRDRDRGLRGPTTALTEADADAAPLGESAGIQTQPRQIRTLGATVAALTPQFRRKLALPESAAGVVITKLAFDGVAAQDGLLVNDVIEKIGQVRVRTPSDLEALIEATVRSRQPSSLLIIRNGVESTVVIAVRGR